MSNHYFIPNHQNKFEVTTNKSNSHCILISDWFDLKSKFNQALRLNTPFLYALYYHDQSNQLIFDSMSISNLLPFTIKIGLNDLLINNKIEDSNYQNLKTQMNTDEIIDLFQKNQMQLIKLELDEIKTIYNN